MFASVCRQEGYGNADCAAQNQYTCISLNPPIRHQPCGSVTFVLVDIGLGAVLEELFLEFVTRNVQQLIQEIPHSLYLTVGKARCAFPQVFAALLDRYIRMGR